MTSRNRRRQIANKRPKDESAEGARGAGSGRSWMVRFLAGYWKQLGFASAVSAVLLAVAIGIVQARFPAGESADRLRFDDPFGVTVSPGGITATPGLAMGQRPDPSIDGKTPLDLLPLGQKRQLVPADTGLEILTLHGRRNQAVTILNMRIRVVKQLPPLADSFILNPVFGGGGANVSLRVTVDDPQPIIMDAEQEPLSRVRTTSYFATKHIMLNYGESVVVAVVPSANNAYSEWDIEVDYLVGEQPGRLFINSAGIFDGKQDLSPFKITGVLPAAKYSAIYALADISSSPQRYRRMSAAELCNQLATMPGGNQKIGC